MRARPGGKIFLLPCLTKKVYDMVPHCWIINYKKMYKISHEDINFIKKIRKTWKVE